jgi:uncharacterized damage-inducible protein DinB
MHRRWKTISLGLIFFVGTLNAQQMAPDPYDGIWEGYEGEWRYVSNLLLSLAEAIPEGKYSWRPAPGVRSVSEVLVHVAQGNFYLLSVTGPKMPSDMVHSDLEKALVSKPEVIAALKRSLQAVKVAHAQLKLGDLDRKVQIQGKTVPVGGMYLRIICHDNEHLGQLIAYARSNGITPPWSQSTNRSPQK